MIFARVMLIVLATAIVGSAHAEQPGTNNEQQGSSTQPALEALVSLSQRLEDTLRRQIIHADLGDVHNLTYSIERALKQLEERSGGTGPVADALTEVRRATERGDQLAAKRAADLYLSQLERFLIHYLDSQPSQR